MELTNSQMVLVTELHMLIEKLKSEGRQFEEIRKACIEKGRDHWLVTERKEQDEAIKAAIYVYAMTDEQRNAVNKFMELLQEQK